MKPPAKPKEVKSAEDLAAAMVEAIRQHERNCRCPHCLSHQMQCVECEWCRANLRKLLVDSLTSAPFFVLNSDEDRATIAAMKKNSKTKSRKSAAKTKASKLTRKVTPKLHAAKKRAIPVSRHPKKRAALAKAHKAPVAHKATPHRKTVARKRTAAAGQYDHCIFTRLGSDERKELIRKAADATGASMAEYVAHFAAEAARAGTALPAVEKPVGGKKEKVTEIGSRILAAFDSKDVKQLVVKAAKAAKVSASSYIAHFAVEAAKAGRKVPQMAKAEPAEAVA
jgi:uncharacterized protein (DUF1778 family)